MLNYIIWGLAIWGRSLEREGSYVVRKTLSKVTLRAMPDYEEPFVRHVFPELFAPPIPVDRLIRGFFYDMRHGKDLISTVRS